MCYVDRVVPLVFIIDYGLDLAYIQAVSGYYMNKINTGKTRQHKENLTPQSVFRVKRNGVKRKRKKEKT